MRARWALGIIRAHERAPPIALLASCRGPPEDHLRVKAFRGVERASHPYRLDVTVEASEPADADLLGRQATLTITHQGAPARTVCGVVSRVERLGSLAPPRRLSLLRLVPRLALLGKRRTSRVFQERTVQEIVDAMLDAAAVPRKWTLVERYPRRTYCVQYQETDLAFVERLLAEEGISYFFEHGDGVAAAETVVLSDSPLLHPPIPGDDKLVFRRDAAAQGLVAEEHHVHRFARRARVEPTRLVLRDHDFLRPRVDVHALAEVEPIPTIGALTEHHHDPMDEPPNIEPRGAQRRLEQARRKLTTASGESLCRRLLPGHRFVLTEHDEEGDNGAYLLSRVVHEGRAPELIGPDEQSYRASFDCLPASSPLRPARPAPRMRQLTETAVVVGPPGEEIHTDEHGRVKIQFPWDVEGKHDEKSSCWVRVSQVMAGPGWGFQLGAAPLERWELAHFTRRSWGLRISSGIGSGTRPAA